MPTHTSQPATTLLRSHARLSTLPLGLALALGLPLAALAQTATQLATLAPSPALQLKRVTLSQAGIGYFEYEAQVSGSATLQLPIKLDHVNDVLKSLVVYDSAGALGGVSLAGKEPLAEVFKTLPFDPSALVNTADLLRALQGAVVNVELPGAKLSGRVLGVETVERSTQPSKGPESKAPIQRVSLSTASGLQSFVLQDARKLEFADPALRRQIESALQAMAANRGKDGRTLDISVTGQGTRTVRVGHVAPVPMWKTSYRLAVPPAGVQGADANQALLQAWAVVENLSGQDWTGVQLTLTSGRPVTFQQPLYDSVFNERPTVPVDLPLRVLPRADSGVFAGARSESFMPAPAMAAPMARSAPPPPPPPPSPAPAAPRAFAMPQAVRGASADMAQQAESLVALSSSNLQAAASEQDTNAVYRFGVPITVTNGRSVSVPIVQTQVPAKVIAQLQPQVDATRPLAAYEITNSTAVGLSPGAVTLYTQATSQQAGSFLGDAQIGNIPAGQSRLLAYAIHPGLSVLRDTPINREEQQRVVVERDLVAVTSIFVTEHRYRVRNTGATPADVLIELYRPAPNAELRAPSAKVDGDTGQAWRLSLSAAPQTTTPHALQVLLPRRSSEALNRLTIEQAARWRDAASDVTSKATLAELVTLRSAERDARNALSQAEQRVRDVEGQQNQTRENIRPLEERSPLRKQFEATLAKQQTELERHVAARAEAQEKVRISEAMLTRFFDARMGS